MQGKYYELKDLHVNDYVTIESLDKIIERRILLDPNDFKIVNGEKKWKVLHIGSKKIEDEEYIEDLGYKLSEVFAIYNPYDITDEMISEEE